MDFLRDHQSRIAAGARGWTAAAGSTGSFLAQKSLDPVVQDGVGAALDFAGQFHDFQDLFRSKAGCGSLFMVVFKTRNAVCCGGSPEANQERSFFVHETFPPYLIIYL
jgi:hypothetical protein